MPSARLFDLYYVEEYEQVCSKGLALSGETTEYFAAITIEYTASC